MNLLKSLSLVALSTSLIFTACKKDDDKNDNSPAAQLAQAKTAIVAKWKAQSEVYTEYNPLGAKIDEETTNYTGDDMTLDINSNNTYQIKYEDGSLETGKYELKEQATKHGVTGYYLSILYGNATTETDYAIANISGSTLVLNQFDTDLDSNNKEYLAEKIVLTFKK